ncbi:DUF4367 domain-containing protein [Marvinbryantia formatexigens]|nr:DUF4367 domain-containing protein [Marvinbryantia formatexigens]UWO25559.1 DUF4367 domain-containing protein [Marvinbryantia formatexigens DSM 14469]SDG19873.1 hypothetical protein SAMN05660368_02110 [Marvinbryantia formatexigens]
MQSDNLRQKLKQDFPQMPPEIHNIIGQEVNRQLTSSPRRSSAKQRLLFFILAAALLLGTVAFAGLQFYQLYVENEGTYGRKIHVEGNVGRDEADSSEASDTTNSGAAGTSDAGRTDTNGSGATDTDGARSWLQFHYIPEGMGLDYNGFKLHFADSSWAISVFQIPLEADTSTESLVLSENYVTFSEELEIGNHQAVYLTLQNTSDTPTGLSENSAPGARQKIYMLCPEAETVLEAVASPEVSKDELIKVLENIELTATHKSPADQNTADETGISLIEAAVNLFKALLPEPESKDSPVQTSFTAEEIAQMPSTGEPVSVPCGADTANRQNDVTNDITAEVIRVQVADDLSLLEVPAYIPSWWSDVTDENGKLKPNEISYIRRGDGVRTLDEVLKTEFIPQKLVFVTVAYTNTGSETLKNICFFITPCAIAEKNGSYSLYTDSTELRSDLYNHRATPGNTATENSGGQNDAAAGNSGGLTCDYSHFTGAASFSMPYFAPHGGTQRHGGNYITELKPQETIFIHAAAIINADELPYLFLNLNAVTGNDYYETFSQRYVDIRSDISFSQ